MKKFVALLAVLCLVFTAALTFSYNEKTSPEQEAPAESETPAVEEVETEQISIQSLDFDAIKALYDSDMVVMTIDGKDVTWGEYFYILFADAQNVISEFNYYQTYFGMTMKWSDSMSDDPEDTYAAYVVDNIDGFLSQFKTILGFAEENGVELSQEHIDSLAAQAQSDAVSLCGEGAGDEELNAYLEEIYLPRKMYDEMNLVNLYYQENFNQIYGPNGENISDEEAMQYLADNGYMRADHILFKTVDESYQPLEESVVAEKRTQAEAVAAELAAIENTEERIARFYELKAECTEDGAYVYYPEGYTFTPGTMVSAFENGYNSLADNEISGVVESEYGCHIMLRLSLDADAVIEYSEAGTALSARSLVANTKYGEALQAYDDNVEIIYAEGFEKPDLLKYVIEA